MLDRNVKAKVDRIAKIIKAENPQQLLERYVKVLDKIELDVVLLKTELEDNLKAWRNGKV